jgi:hypothetical protein
MPDVRADAHARTDASPQESDGLVLILLVLALLTAVVTLTA